MQPLLWQRGKLLIVQEAQGFTRDLYKAVCSPMAGFSEASVCTQRCSLSQSPEFGKPPLDVGLTAMTGPDPWASLKPFLCVYLTHLTAGDTAL